MESSVQGSVVIIGEPCQTPVQLFRSETFQRLLGQFLRRLEKRGSPLLAAVDPFRQGEAPPANESERAGGKGGSAYDLAGIADLLVLLSSRRLENVRNLAPRFAAALADRIVWHDFIEEFYNFWRSHERFMIVEGRENLPGVMLPRHQSLIGLNETVKSLILETYRQITANLTGAFPRVCRQLPAGAGVGLLVERAEWRLPSETYAPLAEIPFIQQVVIEPPLIYYPKRNFRRGSFVPVAENPLPRAKLNPSEWLCYPAMVGELLTFIFFHRRYLAMGASLANLFEFAEARDFAGKTPDAILVFGVDPEVVGEEATVYCEDRAAGVTLGFVAHSEDVDYFGYFKKMALTLHNVIMIERGRLPVHGAMASIELRTGQSANIVLVGDSGAGKSETLEAFRVLADEYIRRLTVVFDDMGSLRLAEDGTVLGYGTEIGAFVRLDDLQPGFAYSEVERAIFMNPHKTNARLVIPLTPYRDVVAGHRVDYFLYANNYERVEEGRPYLEFFSNVQAALRVFSEGTRMAKGTTDEHGLTGSYFANPFGAPQKREQHDRLARRYVEAMMRAGVKVGQLRTQLGLEGYELGGPELAARALFDHLRH
ncbi:MAG TPA: phosphoenolpyruvate carboxykinase [Firmicutes bacterium]|nr:phosphoenolpyruvate carboxykinase [Bacillota bacterium]